MPRSVFWFAAAMALFPSGNALVLSVAVLVGERLALNPAYVTLPLLGQYLGIILATIPMAHLMMRHTRRLGFILGSIGGLLGVAFAIWGIVSPSLTLFAIGLFFTGIAIGTAQQYRFAALEEAPPALHAKAIGIVISGGIVAAIIGPGLAIATRTAWPNLPFIGTFIALGMIYLAALLLQYFLPLKTLSRPKGDPTRPKRSYPRLYAQPLLWCIGLISAVAYGLLVYTIGAFPLAMKADGFVFKEIAMVFQCHILGMFAPSVLTGRFIQRWGANTFVFLGLGCLVLAFAINLMGNGFYHYLTALVFLGLSWNFILISTTQLLPKTYQAHEKAKVQGATDFLIYGMGALGSLLAGLSFYLLGWTSLNGLGLIIAIALVAVAVHQRRLFMP